MTVCFSLHKKSCIGETEIWQKQMNKLYNGNLQTIPILIMENSKAFLIQNVWDHIRIVFFPTGITFCINLIVHSVLENSILLKANMLQLLPLSFICYCYTWEIWSVFRFITLINIIPHKTHWIQWGLYTVCLSFFLISINVL